MSRIAPADIRRNRHKVARPIETAARVQVNAAFHEMRLDTIAIELNLVQPLGADGNFPVQGRELWRNKPRIFCSLGAFNDARLERTQ